MSVDRILADEEKRSRMSALARSFPSLSSRCPEACSCGIDPWDPVRLTRCAEAWTSTEQEIVAFLLSVWNARQELGGTFRLVEAMAKWSGPDRQALVHWAAEPFSF